MKRAHGARRSWLSGGIAASILGTFWLSSRYPALDAKAGMGMGGRIELDALGFDHVFAAGADAALWLRVLATFGNWCVTNKTGMLFGVVFAAAFLTWLSAAGLGQPRSRLLRALKGVFIGAPLGVCANCAAPVGQGLIAAGERRETVVAAVVASPTLNVVVLGMVFGLFPLHMAAGKVAVTAVILLGLIPMLARLGGPEPEPMTLGLSIDLVSTEESWAESVRGVVRDLWRNLVYIVRTTVPLMALAGLLGAVVVEVLPLESLISASGGIATLALTAVVGTFLPVPITFDVIIAYTLLQAGLDPALAMVLLVTLGTYSVYPMSILWRGTSPVVAGGLFVGVAVLGGVSGALVGAVDTEQQRAIEAVVASLPEAPSETLSERIAATCAPIEIPQLRAGCEQRTLDFMVRKLESEDRCDRLPDAARGRCRFRQLIGHTETTAEDVRALCATLAPLDAVERCITDGAAQALRAGWCETLQQPQPCRDAVSTASVLRGEDPAACERLPDPAGCRSSMISSLARGSANPALCDTLPPAQADTCRLQVAQHRSRTVRDPALCDVVEAAGGPRFGQDCRRFHAVFDAIVSGDPARCAATRDAGYCWQQQVANIRAIAAHVGRPDQLDVALGAPRTIAAPAEPAPPPRTAPDLRVDREGGVTLLSSPHRPRAGSGTGFRRVEGPAIGLDEGPPETLPFHEPFVYGRGVALGDLDGDRLPDIALARPDGVALFVNDGAGRFHRLPTPADLRLDALAVALADVDGDARLDVVATGYGGDVVVVSNDGERFQSAPRVQRVPGTRTATLGLGLGDLDHDGDPDLVLGNWTLGAAGGYDPVRSGNTVVWNDGETWRPTPLADGAPGETLSVLIADLDGDAWLDVVVGNDGPAPDQVHVGSPDGLQHRSWSEGPLTHTSWFTMAYDAGDIDNDGDLDLFSSDMSFQTTADRTLCGRLDDQRAAEHCETQLALRRAVRDWSVEACEALPEAAAQSCRLSLVVELAARRDDATLCARLPPGAARTLCEAHTSTASGHHGLSDDHRPQVHHNALHVQTPEGFVDRAVALGVAESFWSWSARFVDADGDGWLDLAVSNGYLLNGPLPGQLHPNLLFRNTGGEGFERAEAELGFDDRLHTSAMAWADLDGDGDLDAVGRGALVPTRVWWNEDTRHHAVTISLEDATDNGRALGARVRITAGGLSQIREIRASGGFLSTDAPVAHFGLGEVDRIDELEIRWPTGEVSRLTGPLAADRHYVVRRSAP